MDAKEALKDIYDLIQKLEQDEKLKKNASGGKVYTDEPVLRTASQIPRPAARAAIPEKIRQMRELAFADNMYWQPKEYIFREQARFMADFEDDLDYTGVFERYFPTYADMNIEQLRGYFTWRVRARKGELGGAPKSFISVYCYELINGVGAKSPEDSIAKLTAVRESADCPDSLKKDIAQWIKDLVIYHGLPAQDYDLPGRDGEAAVSSLMHSAERGDDELFGAIKLMSSYDIEKSSFYKAYLDDFKAAACGLFRSLAASDAAFVSRMSGERIKMYYHPFRTAVFCDRQRNRTYSCKLSENESYEYKNRIWYCEKTNTVPRSGKELGSLMRSLDCLMRNEYGFRFKLRNCTPTPQEEEAIASELEKLRESRLRARAEEIEIDVTKLGGIRQASEITRDKLIVDEEEQPVHIAEPGPAEGPEVTEPEPSDDLPLTDAERGFLRCLLYGGDANAAAKASGSMPSLLADSINEKLYDIFGDTVTDLSGGVPCVIDDYKEELKGMIPG